MDREVLFKGKRIDNGEWVYGFYVKKQDPFLTGVEYHFIVTQDRDNCGCLLSCVSWYKVIPETVGQFIGRYDKNDKKIFNNDIVKTKYGRKCVVVWFSSDKYNAWDLKPIGNYECKAPDKYDLWNPENLEVVGNIFDDKTNKAMENTPPQENLSN